MLSRVADSLYWMGRNIERAENNARILSVQLIQMLESSEEEILANHDWEIIFEICASKASFEPFNQHQESYGDAGDAIIQYLSFAEDNPNSIANCVRLARENARFTRNHLPNDFWEIWNGFYLYTQQARSTHGSKKDIQQFLQQMKMTSLTAQGDIESSMSRGAAYRFIKIGKWLERAEKTARILNVICNINGRNENGHPDENYYYWRSALQLVNGYEAYLKQFPPLMDSKTVLSFLVADDTFPRSIRYCMNHVRDAIRELENGKVTQFSWEMYASLDALMDEFDEVKIKELNSDELSIFLDQFQNSCNEIGRIFAKTYYLIEPVPLIGKDGNAGFRRQYQNTGARSFMKYQIVHTNTFEYETAVDQSMNTIRLKPLTDECQRLVAYRADILPASLTKEHTDLWGNQVETFFIPEQHYLLEVKTTSVVSIQRSPFIHRIDYSPEMEAIFHSELFRHHYLAYLNDTGYTYLLPHQVQEVVDEIGKIDNPVQFSIDVMRYLFEKFTYNGDSTNVDTKAQESFELKRGVCQDTTHVMLGILRAKNIPARYVSGYLYVGEDSALRGDSATHAWVEVMVPGIGWVGLDPTNNVEALENHIRVGTGRDYADVSPLQGVYRGGNQTLDVRVSVTLID
jgi:uncharacterized alpha-E superfamily protein/transglutaminase-like putative cysteine protease